MEYNASFFWSVAWIVLTLSAVVATIVAYMREKSKEKAARELLANRDANQGFKDEPEEGATGDGFSAEENFDFPQEVIR